MRDFLEPSADAIVQHLALGLRGRDPILDEPLARRVRMELEEDGRFEPTPEDRPWRVTVLPGSEKPRLNRGPTGGYVLLYHRNLPEEVVVRIYDTRRRYVPRRLRVPILAEGGVRKRPATDRFRFPVLFPGAAWDLGAGATGLRGEVLREGGKKRMRWGAVSAARPADGTVVGRGRVDDRGEFLLLLGPAAAPGADLPESLPLRVSVFGPEVPPAADPKRAREDPWWDLPVEAVPPAGDPDPVSSGEELPAGYEELGPPRTVSFVPGEIKTDDEAKFEFD